MIDDAGIKSCIWHSKRLKCVTTLPSPNSSHNRSGSIQSMTQFCHNNPTLSVTNWGGIGTNQVFRSIDSDSVVSFPEINHAIVARGLVGGDFSSRASIFHVCNSINSATSAISAVYAFWPCPSVHALLPMLEMLELQKVAVYISCSKAPKHFYWLSCSDKGKVTDSSIQKAYIHAIRRAQHFIYVSAVHYHFSEGASHLHHLPAFHACLHACLPTCLPAPSISKVAPSLKFWFQPISTQIFC